MGGRFGWLVDFSLGRVFLFMVVFLFVLGGFLGGLFVCFTCYYQLFVCFQEGSSAKGSILLSYIFVFTVIY